MSKLRFTIKAVKIVLHLAGPKSSQLLEIIEPRSQDLKFLHRLNSKFCKSDTTVDLFEALQVV